ncbi:MAG: transposase [Nanoarchaeota archaeon]
MAQIIPVDPYQFGRPPIQVRDLFFCAVLKLYNNHSGRKMSFDLKNAEGAGYISKAPHFNTITDFLNCPDTYYLLKKILTISAMPLAELEDEYSLDSSGFASHQFDRWKNVRFGLASNAWTKRRNFLKGHVAIGTRTHIICACEISSGYDADVKKAPMLLQTLGDNFKVKELSADGAYSSKRIHQLVESIGATPFIPFSPARNPDKYAPEIWLRMYRYFSSHKEEFLRHYHRRSNVETVFSMVKVRLGEFLRCKSEIGKKSELMLKFIAHNLCCIVSEMFENNLHINFTNCLLKFVERKEEEFKKDNDKK